MTKKNTNIPLSFNANGIAVFKMAAYDVPTFKEVTGKDWIYFGKKNEYPYYLIDLFNRSSKHNAIVNGKAKYIYGQGIGKLGEEIINTDGDTFGEIIHKSILDCVLFSGFYLEVIWDKGAKTIAEIRHMDYSSMRSNKDNTKFFWSEQWAKPSSETPGTFITNNNPQDVVVYEPYDENNKTGKQIFFYKAYRPGLLTYPLPEYQGATVHIDIDVQIADYWSNAIHNGFSASHIINFYNGVPTEKEQEVLEENISKKLTGARSKKFILNFTDLKDKGSDVQKLEPEDLDKHLQILNQTVQQEIFTGHHITSPMLFGIKEASQLGGRNELVEANELFQNLYVSPKQQMFEKLFSVIAKAKGLKGDIKFTKIEPIGYLFSEATMISVLPKKAIAEMVAQRMGVDLTKYPEMEKEMQQKEAEKNKFSKENRILFELKKKAKKRGGKVLKSRPMDVAYIKNVSQSEQEFADLVKKDPAVVSIINPPTNNTGSNSIDYTPKIEVVYTYEWRDAIPVGERDTEDHPSRDFCVEMMALSETGHTWTREDIEQLSLREDHDVWQMRGGWLTVEGNVHLPYCRHIWVQKVIIT